MLINQTQDPLLSCSESAFELYRSPLAIENPEISVVVSTYNRCRSEGECKSLLKRAIDSILNQTFTRFELILIDDHSSDDTKNFCEKIVLDDPRVCFYHFKQNSGLPAKRYNFGISVTRAKYVTFMFDDDELELNALEALYRGIEKDHKNCAMVYGSATIYRGSDRINSEVLGEKWGWNRIQFHNFIANNSVIVKRSVFDIVGGYDEDPVFSRVCDWDLWWRIGRKFRVGRIECKVGIVYSELSDSIGLNRILSWEACKKKQKGQRVLPLQVPGKEPLRCKLQAVLFDLYASFRKKFVLKSMVKKILPSRIYQFFKDVKGSFKTN